MSYRIKTVEKLTGLSRNTITAWERRYDLLEPVKDASGYRIYSDEDVKTLLRVRSLLDEGYQIGEIVLRLRKEAVPNITPPSNRLEVWRSELLTALLAFNRADADGVSARLLDLSYRQRIDEIFLPLLREIGSGWEAGRVSIAQEHFASAYIREQLVSIYRTLDDGHKLGPVVICAAYPGELHELGLLSVAIHLVLQGYHLVYLGADLPFSELPAVVERQSADLVCLSVFHAPAQEIEENAAFLQRSLPKNVRVIFGGPATATLASRSQGNLWFCPKLEDLLGRIATSHSNSAG